MVHYIKLALVLLLSLSVYVSAQQLVAYRQHEALLKQYPCGTPQPRVFELEDVIGADVLKEKTSDHLYLIKPAITVLHRCYSSGCCQNPLEKCQEVEEEDVKLTFLILGKSVSYLEVEAVNHTKCACRT